MSNKKQLLTVFVSFYSYYFIDNNIRYSHCRIVNERKAISKKSGKIRIWQSNRSIVGCVPSNWPFFYGFSLYKPADVQQSCMRVVTVTPIKSHLVVKAPSSGRPWVSQGFALESNRWSGRDEYGSNACSTISSEWKTNKALI